MKALAPMSWFDQSDARAPPKHVTFPPELQQQLTCSYAIHTATRSTAAPCERSVRQLVSKTQIPVVHATICQAWQIHKRLSVRETTPGFGRLLAELP